VANATPAAGTVADTAGQATTDGAASSGPAASAGATPSSTLTTNTGPASGTGTSTGSGTPAGTETRTGTDTPTSTVATPSSLVARSRTRLAGRTIVLDPGHQLGNSAHLSQVNRLVNAGNGIRKACNTTGTSTNAGYPESRFALRVALATKARLEAMGATVVLTRSREDRALWGPCIDVRGRVGNRVRADAVVSIHADGAPAPDRGFHVIRPGSVPGWTADIATASARLAVDVHGALVARGARPAAYIGSRDGYDVRSDLGTLNWSDRPIVMVEFGNMRSAADARQLTDPHWQDRVAAAALAAGIADFLAP
jgi:N-acetylmuramoyl-L-alanine amidase